MSTQDKISVVILVASIFALYLYIFEENYEVIPVFIIAGQSNAVGYRASWHELPTKWKQPNDNVMFWYLQGSLQRPLASNGWVKLAGLEHCSIPMVGSELSVGQLATAELGSQIAIVKIAFNGTALAQVDGLDWNVQSGNELLAQLINETNRALSGMPKRTKGKIAGLFWIQGESDARNTSTQPEMSQLYRSNLEALIHEFRREYTKTDLPVVIARIAVPEIDASGRNFSYRQAIRESQYDIAQNDPYVAMVSMDDLPMQSDALHLTALGQLELGRRLITEWLNLVHD